MINRAELKSYAKSRLRGKWGLAIGSTIVILLIQFAFNFISRLAEDKIALFIFITLVSMVISTVMTIGMCRFSLNYAYEDKNPELKDIFSGFSVILKAIGLSILVGIIVIVGTILLIVPGIILSFMFSQAYYILADDNSKSIIQCLKESAAMMKGYKFEYFILSLSFLGWIILGMIPLGIGLIWVVPYMNVTIASFYLKVKNNYYESNVVG
jgi:uncharacterized membrane protein